MKQMIFAVGVLALSVTACKKKNRNMTLEEVFDRYQKVIESKIKDIENEINILSLSLEKVEHLGNELYHIRQNIISLLAKGFPEVLWNNVDYRIRLIDNHNETFNYLTGLYDKMISPQ